MKPAGEIPGADLPEAPAQWDRGLVLLCSKCSGQQHGQPNPALMPSWDTWQLRCWLKKRLSAAGRWPGVRVVTTSCLGVCAPGKITCALGADAAGVDHPRCVVVDPEADAEALLGWIERSVDGG